MKTRSTFMSNVAEDSGASARQFHQIRQATERLCAPLEIDDFGIQSMPDASPVKWHLAHTTWFFETFVLSVAWPDYKPFNAKFGHLFNSYYNAVGPRWPRSERGQLSRPTVAEVYRYRTEVNERIAELFEPSRAALLARVASALRLGLHHEQQHQELIVTDMKNAWAANPLQPIYRERASERIQPPRPSWIPYPEGISSIGHHGAGFAFDNELPRHRVFLQSFQLANRLTTNGDYLEFMADGGYRRPELWLSDGWATVQNRGWSAPLYWEDDYGNWSTYTLAGARPVDPFEPVCHLSFFEADAFARWAGARLPAETEWEVAAAGRPPAGNFLESKNFQPTSHVADDDLGPLFQMFGDAWQWTASPYVAYPGYAPPSGALGEYNGKFMCNQLVLRGASCATPRSHARATYRNFFPAEARWQFAGLRLAKDLP